MFRAGAAARACGLLGLLIGSTVFFSRRMLRVHVLRFAWTSSFLTSSYCKWISGLSHWLGSRAVDGPLAGIVPVFWSFGTGLSLVGAPSAHWESTVLQGQVHQKVLQGAGPERFDL